MWNIESSAYRNFERLGLSFECFKLKVSNYYNVWLKSSFYFVKSTEKHIICFTPKILEISLFANLGSIKWLSPKPSPISSAPSFSRYLQAVMSCELISSWALSWNRNTRMFSELMDPSNIWFIFLTVWLRPIVKIPFFYNSRVFLTEFAYLSIFVSFMSLCLFVYGSCSSISDILSKMSGKVLLTNVLVLLLGIVSK